MTVAAAIPIYRYDGNDSATTFPFSQIFRADGDLYVVHRSTAGVNTYPVLDTDYTVTGEGTTSAGSVEFPKGGSAYPTLATGESLAILRASDKARLTNMTASYFFNDLNIGEDNTVMMIQELAEGLSRCAQLLVTNSDTPPSLESMLVTGGDGNHANLTTASLTYALSAHTNFMENIHYLAFPLVAATVDCAEGTNIFGDFEMPFSGTFLQSDTVRYLYATNSTAGVTGTMVIDVSLDGTSIMTTNKINIDTTEKTSFTAATKPDLTTTPFVAGQIVTIDVDSVHTTAAKGLILIMAVRQS